MRYFNLDKLQRKTHCSSSAYMLMLCFVSLIGDELRWKFSSDGSVNGWGWRFTVYPVMDHDGPTGSDRDMLSKPSVELVMCLLEPCLNLAPHRSLITRLAAALASCSQLSSLGKTRRNNQLYQIYLNNEPILLFNALC